MYYVLDKPFAGLHLPVHCHMLVAAVTVWRLLGRLSNVWCWSRGSGTIPWTSQPKVPLWLHGLHVLCFVDRKGCTSKSIATGLALRLASFGVQAARFSASYGQACEDLLDWLGGLHLEIDMPDGDLGQAVVARAGND